MHHLWGSWFYWKCSKFNLAFKNAETKWEKIICCWDNCIWIGCLKLSALGRGYLWSAVNMLTNILKTIHITKRDFLPPQLPSQWSIIMVKVVPFRFQQCLVPLSMLLVEGPLKWDFLGIYLTTLLGFRNFGNASAVRVIFFLKIFKT